MQRYILHQTLAVAFTKPFSVGLWHWTLQGIASYEVMRKWIDRLFALYAQFPAPGFSRISQSQLLRADRQAFIRMSELFTGSLKAPIAAGKPLDPYIEKLESDMTVTYFRLPVPTGHAR